MLDLGWLPEWMRKHGLLFGPGGSTSFGPGGGVDLGMVAPLRRRHIVNTSNAVKEPIGLRVYQGQISSGDTNTKVLQAVPTYLYDTVYWAARLPAGMSAVQFFPQISAVDAGVQDGQVGTYTGGTIPDAIPVLAGAIDRGAGSSGQVAFASGVIRVPLTDMPICVHFKGSSFSGSAQVTLSLGTTGYGG